MAYEKLYGYPTGWTTAVSSHSSNGGDLMSEPAPVLLKKRLYTSRELIAALGPIERRIAEYLVRIGDLVVIDFNELLRRTSEHPTEDELLVENSIGKTGTKEFVGMDRTAIETPYTTELYREAHGGKQNVSN